MNDKIILEYLKDLIVNLLEIDTTGDINNQIESILKNGEEVITESIIYNDYKYLELNTNEKDVLYKNEDPKKYLENLLLGIGDLKNDIEKDLGIYDDGDREEEKERTLRDITKGI